MNTIPVIVNTASGVGFDDEKTADLARHFREAGLEARIFSARSGEEITALVREAMSDSPPVLVAAGGDGTVSSIAAIVHSTGTVLGVLPLGTLNHFARDLQIPFDIGEAVRIVAANRQAALDVGEVNGRVFINNSSLGLYPEIVRDRASQQRRLGRGKKSASVWATLTALRLSPFMRITLSVDGEKSAYRVPFVFVGNNEYDMEGFNIGKRDSLRGGRLSLYVTQRSGRLGLVALGLRALFGRLRQARDFEAMAAHELEVVSRHRVLPVATDGEVTAMQTPLRYRILPGALKVIVP